MTPYFGTHRCDAKRHSCPHCDKTFLHEARRNEHVATVHLNVQDFECQFCQKKWANSRLLTQHITAVHDNKECDVCMKVLPNKYELRKHKFVAHGDTSQGILYPCSYCKKVFANEDSCTIHMAKKHAEK